MPVIGLEIHVQLGTRTRLFSACPRATDTDARPNAFTDPVTLGLPGTLPVLNREAVTLALRLGLAFGCDLEQRSEFDRKHYFYPDLPRNFQITQERKPLLNGGAIRYGHQDQLPLIRCHIEEDAGRSVHLDGRTRVDFNRAGVGLLEIVTKPALTKPEQASAVLGRVRELARWLGVNDGSLEKGQIRCDANVSLAGGARVEIKNLNSIRGVARALAAEIERQKDLVARGEPVVPQTRGWDADRGETFAQRGKEGVVDYRFLPEPDLGPLVVDAVWVESVTRAMPELPEAVRRRWCAAGMEPAASIVLSSSRSRAIWVDRLLEAGAPAEELGRWGTGELLRRARDLDADLAALPWSAQDLAMLIQQVGRGDRSHASARDLLDAPDLAESLRDQPPRTPEPVDERLLREMLAAHPDQVAHYRSGKTGLLGWFVAEARRSLPGSPDPVALATTLRRLLSGDDR
jgi:aspartyl-tRNA(Asn)/glutamyl-tRNA(Gln) amidotransferase subunit B